MKKQIRVKFTKVEAHWNLARIFDIQKKLTNRSLAGGAHRTPLRETNFNDMHRNGIGYAFLTSEQIQSVKKEFLMVDMKGNIY